MVENQKPMNDAQKNEFMDRVRAFTREETEMVIGHAPIEMILDRVRSEIDDYYSLLKSVKALSEKVM